jgi:hypothetical protein
MTNPAPGRTRSWRDVIPIHPAAEALPRAGVAITAGAVLLIAIPVVMGAGLVASLYRVLRP